MKHATESDFLVGEALEQDALEGLLADRLRLGPPLRETRRYLYADTFDWRLTARGERLALVRPGPSGRAQLSWRSKDGALRYTAGKQLPDFAAELGEFTELAKTSQNRRLFPVVRVDVHEVLIAVLNREQKTVARLWIERGSARHPKSRAAGTELPLRLGVRALRGYDKDFARTVSTLCDALELEPTDADRMQVGLAALEVETQAPSSGVGLELDPELRTYDAVRAIAGALLATIRHNEAGTRANLDPEFLHDFRVAVRRTRSLLTQVKGVLEPSVFEQTRIQFKWLQEITGPSRDLDVLLECWDGYVRGVPVEVQDGLVPFAHELVERRRAAQKKLSRTLGSKTYRAVIEGWQAFLDSPTPEEFRGGRAALPVGQVADERIVKAFRRVLKHGASINAETPTEDVHALRIDCKKLRYLLEFFRGLYPDEQLAPLIKQLKGLQNVLGDFNDRSVHAELLSELALGSGVTDLEQTRARLLALGQLIEHLRVLREDERRLFADRFEPLSTKAFRHSVERLFGSHSRSSQGAKS